MHIRWLLLVALCGTITMALQTWVGDATIYAKDLAERRAVMHRAILTNIPPDGSTWADVGAGSHNIRIGAVYLAEAVSRVTGFSIGQTYKLLDTVFLFAILAGMFLYLRHWVPDIYALVGLLYLAVILPMTYFQHFFQPWDRLQLLLWLPMLAAVRDGRFVLVAIILALSMFVKFDAILVPGLYFLAHVRRDSWQLVTAQSVVLSVIALGIYVGLTIAFPAPGEPPRFGVDWMGQQVPKNIAAFATLNLGHPILLGLGLPALLAVMGIRHADRFLRASLLLAAAMSIVWFLFTVYAELRAQLPALLLLMPAALLSLQRLLDASATLGSRR